MLQIMSELVWYQPPLLGDIHLILEVPAVRGLGVLNLPAEVLYLCLQLGLLVLKLKKECVTIATRVFFCSGRRLRYFY